MLSLVFIQRVGFLLSPSLLIVSSLDPGADIVDKFGRTGIPNGTDLRWCTIFRPQSIRDRLDQCDTRVDISFGLLEFEPFFATNAGPRLIPDIHG